MNKVKLVAEAKYWWRMYCVHALTIAGAIPAAFAAMPKNWQDHSEWLLWGLSPFVAASGIVGRVIEQPSLRPCADDAQDSQAKPAVKPTTEVPA